MSYSNFPSDPRIAIVADTSVIINLNATNSAADIINSLSNPFVVAQQAVDELASGVACGHSDSEMLGDLIDNGFVRIVPLGAAANSVYESLIEGPAVGTLDDGEAATIALACEIEAIAAIDERKARRICKNEFQNLVLATTVEVLTHELVESKIGPQRVADGIVSALIDARMRVLPEQLNRVISFIGADRAAGCNSLPRSIRSAS